MICGLLFATVTFANAQQGRPGGGRMMFTPEERLKQLDEKVKLTDEQKTKASAIYTETADTQKKMREEMQAGGDRRAMMEKMQKLSADTDTKLNAIFTAEQKATYKVWQDELKAEREKMMRERRAGGQ